MNKISTATREQVKGGEMISVAMDRVSDMVNQIVTAIREQESGSKLIINVSEQMRDMTSKINSSTREQSDASRNVAARSVEMDVCDVRQSLFARCAAETDELGSHISITIVTLRMRRIKGQDGYGFLSVPERHQIQFRINRPFWRGNRRRVPS